MALLRRGLIGEPVRILQEHLGVPADGIFGKATETALRQHQKEHGLSVDGIAGPDTFHSMGLDELVLLERPIRGQMVKRLQEGLGLPADGVFGPGKGKTKKKPSPDPGLPPDAPRGAKLIELGFKKGDEHVQLALVDKTGLFKVAVGQDVPDRKTADRRAQEVSSSLGAVLSEAETESTAFGDATADVQLTITGFQGQRIVAETYRRPDGDHLAQ